VPPQGQPLGRVRPSVGWCSRSCPWGTYTIEVEEAAGPAGSMRPGLAVPMHYGFVVGSSSDAERLRVSSSPVPVEIMTPTDPFERG
jgi:hypothetical protein